MKISAMIVSLKVNLAAGQTFRKASACLTAFLAAGYIASGAMAADKAKKPDKADESEPRNAFEFVKEKAQVWANAYNELSGCVVLKIPKENENYSHWKPEEVYTCKPQLDEFRKARLNVKGWPQNLVWGNGVEKATLTRDATLIDQLHDQIVAYYNYLVSMNRESKQYALMCWYRNMSYWYNDNGKKYRDAMKTIDNLINEYWKAKNKGRMSGDHYECTPDVMKEMQTAMRKLSQYFHYNVDSTRLAPCNKGVFLYDLDAHSVQFKEKRDSARRLMESTLGNLQHRAKDLQNSIKPLAMISKSSPFFKMTSKLPLTLARQIDRMEASITRVRDGMEALADTSSPIGSLLAQSDMGDYTRFAQSPRCSYVDSIRNGLRITLLNTKDKDGKPIKHSLRGQL